MDFAQIGNLDFWHHWWTTHGDNLVTSTGKIATIIVAYMIVRALLSQLISRLFKLTISGNGGDSRMARVGALQSVLRSTVGFVLGFVVGIMVLQAAGLNIVPLLTTASVAGLAIGFGAQKLVKDVISGFFILVEDQYGVGDYVTIGPASGVVEDLGMRTTRIRDAAGKLFIIANGDINQVFNHSRGALRAWIDVPLPVAADVDKARRVLDDLGRSMAAEMPDKIQSPFKSDGLSQIGAEKITVRFMGEVSARHQDEITLAMNERIRSEFQANEISLA
jgi:small-conductance mechanosensitive channel